MEIEYKGGNCVVFSTKKVVIAADTRIEAQDNRKIDTKSDVEISTTIRKDAPEDKLFIDSPGEYEIADVSIKGIPARKHTEVDAKNATMYTLESDGVKIAMLGHVSAELSEEQLERLGVIDILIIPVGGYGYTLEPHEAVAVVKHIGPKIVIPTHYAKKDQTYTIPQGGLEPFVKELGAPVEALQSKYKIKAGSLPEVLTVIEFL